MASSPFKKVVLVGLPNTGKSQIFNNLTGEYTIVANYPGTTIEMKRSVTRIKDTFYEIIDTPGLHCLFIHSEEELAVRDMILAEKPDILVHCLDAGQYKQSFLLLAELLELDIPMVVVLNTIDGTARPGTAIDATELERSLGVPVVASTGLHGLGKKELEEAILRARRGTPGVKYGMRLETAITDLAAALPVELDCRYKIATLLLMKDPFIEKLIETRLGRERTVRVCEEAGRRRVQIIGSVRQVIHDRRNRWVDKLAQVVHKQKEPYSDLAHQVTQATRHPVTGIPIFLVLMAIVYLSLVTVSGAIDKSINFIVVQPVTGLITALSLPLFWHDFLIGNHGLLTLGLFNALCTVLPILTVFFFIFGCFEDSGYITNFTVMSTRIFQKIGIPGNAITALVLGFGCKTMATLSTRGLTVPKEKFIAVFLIAFAIPCSAQMGISMSILARVGFGAFLIVLGTLLVCEMGAGLILNRIIKSKASSSFIQVIPAMRLPGLGAVARKTWHRVMDFLKEAVPIFLLSAVGLFFFEKTGLLGLTKQVLSPVVVGWMGLPRDIVDVFLLALARREAAAGLILKMVETGTLGYVQSIMAVVVTTISFPCAANVIAIGREMGVKVACTMTALIFIISFALAGALHGILFLILGAR